MMDMRSILRGDTLQSVAQSSRPRDVRGLGQVRTLTRTRLSRQRTCAVVAAKEAPKVHMVKSGETLWGIMRKYPGTDLKEVMQLNGMTNSSILSEGQVIRLSPETVQKKWPYSSKQAETKKVYATTQPAKVAPPAPAGAGSIIPCWLCTMQSSVAGILVIWGIWRTRKLAVKAAKEKKETQRRNETTLRRRQEYW
eukprot:2874524-Pyramimonas_sp.AAC.1